MAQHGQGLTSKELGIALDFIWDSLVRINDRQEAHSLDTGEDLDDIQRTVEDLISALRIGD